MVRHIVVAERPQGLSTLIDAAPRDSRPYSQANEAAGYRALALPVLEHQCCTLAPDVDVRVICVPDESVTTPGKLIIKLAQHDI